MVWTLSDEKRGWVEKPVYEPHLRLATPDRCLSPYFPSINVMTRLGPMMFLGAVPHGAEHMNLGGCVAGRGPCLHQRLVLLALLGVWLIGGCAGGPKVIPPE